MKNFVRTIRFLFVLVVLAFPLICQAGSPSWSNSYATKNDGQPGYPLSFLKTSDSYVVTTIASFVDLSAESSLIAKLDQNGGVGWSKSFKATSGKLHALVWASVPVTDGFLVVITLDGDLMLVKTNSAGKVLWKKKYENEASSGQPVVTQTASGFVIATREGRLLFISSNGDLLNQKRLEGVNFSSVHTAIDGSVFVLGRIYDTTTFTYTVIVLKITESLDIVWQKSYKNKKGGLLLDFAPTADDGLALSGYVFENKARLKQDIWFLKLSSSGSIAWQRVYHSAASETAASVIATSDGGYLLAGTISTTGTDGFLIKVDAQGAIQWQRQYRVADQWTSLSHAVEDEDGSFAIAGSFAIIPQTSGKSTKQKLWIIKTDSEGNLDNACDVTVSKTSFAIKGTKTKTGDTSFSFSEAGFITDSAKFKKLKTQLLKKSYCNE